MVSDRRSEQTGGADRRSETMQAILEAAKELVALKGARATTVRDITEACGANGAAVNYYFQSKDALVRLARNGITGDVNRERLRRLEEIEADRGEAALGAREILTALVEPILTVSRSRDGGSLYVRNIFQMRIDAQAGSDNFGLNAPVAHRFVDVLRRSFALSRADAIWQYEFARGAAIHMIANLDPLSRRFELLHLDNGDQLQQEPSMRIDQGQVERIIETILKAWPANIS